MRRRHAPSQEGISSVFLDAMLSGANAAIERQEAHGQGSFINSATLPRQMEDGAREALERSGVKFLGVVPDDDQFQYVALPGGWKKVATDHSMWSDLLDHKGRKRAAIFYKAAVYDRRASLSLTSRFSAICDFDRERKTGEIVAVVKDCERVVYTTEVRRSDGTDRSKYDLTHAAENEAAAWLDQRFPKWRDPGEYWE
jgi:hypothetical protein